MIESIHIADIATFTSTPEVFSNLSSLNYVFGANGTGKITINRVIADEEAVPTCRVTITNVRLTE